LFDNNVSQKHGSTILYFTIVNDNTVVF
jgi:hypothetical protein